MEEDLLHLGAKVEKFLSREVSYVVTNKRNPYGASQTTPSTGVPSPDSTPINRTQGAVAHSCSVSSPLAVSRGQALLLKSNHSKNNWASSPGTDVLSHAKKWGITIVHVTEVKWRIAREMKRCGLVKGSLRQQPVPVKRLQEPFIKYEDDMQMYRVHYQPFIAFPKLSLRGGDEEGYLQCGGCPFGNGPPASVNRKALEAAVTQKKNQERKTVHVPGYCECCKQHYQDFKEHLASDSHRAFGAKDDNYVKLDSTIAKLPSLVEFAARLSQEAGDAGFGSQPDDSDHSGFHGDKTSGGDCHSNEGGDQERRSHCHRESDDKRDTLTDKQPAFQFHVKHGLQAGVDLSDATNRGIPANVVQELLQDHSQDHPQELHQDHPQGCMQDVPQDGPQGYPQDLPQNNPQHHQQDCPHDHCQNVSQDLPQDHPHDHSEDSHQDHPQHLWDSSQKYPQDLSEDHPHAQPLDHRHNFTQDLQDRAHNHPQEHPQDSMGAILMKDCQRHTVNQYDSDHTTEPAQAAVSSSYVTSLNTGHQIPATESSGFKASLGTSVAVSALHVQDMSPAPAPNPEGGSQSDGAQVSSVTSKSPRADYSDVNSLCESDIHPVGDYTKVKKPSCKRSESPLSTAGTLQNNSSDKPRCLIDQIWALALNPLDLSVPLHVPVETSVGRNPESGTSVNSASADCGNTADGLSNFKDLGVKTESSIALSATASALQPLALTDQLKNMFGTGPSRKVNSDAEWELDLGGVCESIIDRLGEDIEADQVASDESRKSLPGASTTAAGIAQAVTVPPEEPFSEIREFETVSPPKDTVQHVFSACPALMPGISELEVLSQYKVCPDSSADYDFGPDDQLPVLMSEVGVEFAHCSIGTGCSLSQDIVPMAFQTPFMDSFVPESSTFNFPVKAGSKNRQKKCDLKVKIFPAKFIHPAKSKAGYCTESKFSKTAHTDKQHKARKPNSTAAEPVIRNSTVVAIETGTPYDNNQTDGVPKVSNVQNIQSTPKNKASKLSMNSESLCAHSSLDHQPFIDSQPQEMHATDQLAASKANDAGQGNTPVSRAKCMVTPEQGADTSPPLGSAPDIIWQVRRSGDCKLTFCRTKTSLAKTREQSEPETYM